MPALTFDIREDHLSGLQHQQITIKHFIDGVLSEDNGNAFTAIAPWLVEFHKRDGGSPVASEIKVAEAEYDSITHSGKVKLAYKVSFTYGCADIFRTDDYTETCKFIIDPEKNKLTLYITDQLTRDTVDEF
ncbi:hypothetical protein [Mucilaginibacter gotjawali]|uniref:Uncharacterized protein n=2 Tax=Mucilaginibacter gotjawali TaxID=1550579 RepID=A0A839S8M6_9SPHI|nr:hypothetical protein [Mucilaginibacter gotjawali]MBB3053722.1 hypothetical protein [Mucilaginibacter gotjawali]BAU53981.1 hypothetical protein MgSA37_02152 [Mucilaginibacter gotjawali]